MPSLSVSLSPVFARILVILLSSLIKPEVELFQDAALSKIPYICLLFIYGKFHACTINSSFFYQSAGLFEEKGLIINFHSLEFCLKSFYELHISFNGFM